MYHTHVLTSSAARFDNKESYVTVLRHLRVRKEAPILVGHLYEAFAHLVLSDGGNFRARRAEDNVHIELQLEKKRMVHLSICKDLQNVRENEYGQGHNTFPALDGITTKPQRLFNMTVTEDTDRGINGDTLRDAFTFLGSFHRPCEYYWVVPADKFDAFTPQQARGMRSGELASLISQFVVEVPIDTQQVNLPKESQDEKSPEKKKQKTSRYVIKK